MKQLAFDIEIFGNYSLLLAADEDGRIVYERSRGALKAQTGRVADLLNAELLTWNGASFDLPLLGAFMSGMSHKGLLRFVDRIIGQSQPGWLVARDAGIETPKPRGHIDLMLVAPGLRIGLKTAGARIHAPTIRDLPYPPGATLTAEQAAEARAYCHNDLDLTWRLYRELEPRVNVRRKSRDPQYALVASDAMIGERAMRKLPGSRRGSGVAKAQNVRPITPPWLKMVSAEAKALMAAMTDREYTFAPPSGRLADAPKHELTLDNVRYSFGVGGMHSRDNGIVARNVTLVDVVSYYPNILMQLNRDPPGAPGFVRALRRVYAERLEAKRQGDETTSAVGKIVLNAASGKLASKWSCMYDPTLYISMTLTGQLTLFMLAERLAASGARVISANTDGLVVDGPLDAARQWEADTGLELEYTRLRYYWARDVSTYFAVTVDGQKKRKGMFASRSLMKMPAGEVIADAAAALMTGAASTAEGHIASIAETGAVEPFVVARKVAGGATWRGAELGKVVRWLFAREPDADPLTYTNNGNLVAGAGKALPVMTLPDRIPDCIDLDAYAAKATDLARSCGWSLP